MERNDDMPLSPTATIDRTAMTNAPATPPDAGDLRRLLKQHFGYDEFRPRQEAIIANALAGRHGLVIIPTGGGKSLCYQLPAMATGGLTLVVSPLIALMKDQVDALRANGIPAAFINSTLSFDELGRVQQAALAGGLRILYAAPERVSTPGFRRFLESLPVGLIAIDEAHCISEWGHDFRPDYRNLAELRSRFPDTPVMALTATATERVREDITAQLRLGDCPRFISSFDRANLTYSVRPKQRAFRKLVELLDERRGESAIIYCFSRRETESLAERLSTSGHPALAYHAGLDPETRRRAQERFIDGEVPIVAATIAFGMGIDKPDIRLVVHYSLPKSIEGYYQETGRAGRDGQPSDCVLFFSEGDRSKLDYFTQQIGDDAARDVAERQLNQVVEFGRLRTCRRKYLLAYFGEAMEGESCGRCDSCLGEYRSVDVTQTAKKILSAVIRTGERFGIGYVNRVLLGSRDKRIGKFGHDQLSVYNIVDDYDRNALRGIAEMLVERGLLAKEEGSLGVMRVTPEGRAWLRGGQSLEIEVRADDSSPQQARRTDESAGRRKESGAAGYDQALFEKLRALRRQLAEEQEVPAFVVFGDAALRGLAAAKPTTPDAMLQVSGVGPAKLQKYGESFLAAIREYGEGDA